MVIASTDSDEKDIKYGNKTPYFLVLGSYRPRAVG